MAPSRRGRDLVGYRAKNKVYRLTWEPGHDLHGFEVQARAMRLGEMLHVASMAAAMKDDASDIEKLIGTFSQVLMSWNREDEDGTPIPANAEALRDMETGEFFALLDAYINAGVGVPDPLPAGSRSGGPFQVELPPMDEL